MDFRRKETAQGEREGGFLRLGGKLIPAVFLPVLSNLRLPVCRMTDRAEPLGFWHWEWVGSGREREKNIILGRSSDGEKPRSCLEGPLGLTLYP